LGRRGRQGRLRCRLRLACRSRRPLIELAGRQLILFIKLRLRRLPAGSLRLLGRLRRRFGLRRLLRRHRHRASDHEPCDQQRAHASMHSVLPEVPSPAQSYTGAIADHPSPGKTAPEWLIPPPTTKVATNAVKMRDFDVYYSIDFDLIHKNGVNVAHKRRF
jgi:hypothetical protein